MVDSDFKPLRLSELPVKSTSLQHTQKSISQSFLVHKSEVNLPVVYCLAIWQLSDYQWLQAPARANKIILLKKVRNVPNFANQVVKNIIAVKNSQLHLLTIY